MALILLPLSRIVRNIPPHPLQWDRGGWSFGSPDRAPPIAAGVGIGPLSSRRTGTRKVRPDGIEVHRLLDVRFTGGTPPLHGPGPRASGARSSHPDRDQRNLSSEMSRGRHRLPAGPDRHLSPTDLPPIEILMDAQKGPEALLRRLIFPRLRASYEDLRLAVKGPTCWYRRAPLCRPDPGGADGATLARDRPAPFSFFSAYDPPVRLPACAGEAQTAWPNSQSGGGRPGAIRRPFRSAPCASCAPSSVCRRAGIRSLMRSFRPTACWRCSRLLFPPPARLAATHQRDRLRLL